MSIDIRVPDIGDFKDVPVIEVFVKVGDTVKAEDPLTLSPTLTEMALTTPPCGAGTSIVALSDSSEISGSSAFTVSPRFT